MTTFLRSSSPWYFAPTTGFAFFGAFDERAAPVPDLGLGTHLPPTTILIPGSDACRQAHLPHWISADVWSLPSGAIFLVGIPAGTDPVAGARTTLKLHRVRSKSRTALFYALLDPRLRRLGQQNGSGTQTAHRSCHPSIPRISWITLSSPRCRFLPQELRWVKDGENAALVACTQSEPKVVCVQSIPVGGDASRDSSDPSFLPPPGIEMVAPQRSIVIMPLNLARHSSSNQQTLYR